MKNVLIRRRNDQPAQTAQRGALDRFCEQVRRGELSGDELLGRYYAVVYAQTGSYERAGRVLGVDRRTVKNSLDSEFLKRLQLGAGAGSGS